MKKAKEEEERAKAEEIEQLKRKSYLVAKSLLRIAYMDVEEHIVDTMTDAYKWLDETVQARRKGKHAIIKIQRQWRRKLAMRAARQYRMSRNVHLYNIEAAANTGDECKKIQASIRGNLTRVRLRRGLDLVLMSDSLVGSKKTLTRGRCAIELYLECYRDFLLTLQDKEVSKHLGSELFLSELLAYREPWNQERAQKKARIFGTSVDEDIARPMAPSDHPAPILRASIA